MALLLIAALVWVMVHVGLAGSPLRAALVARLGEGGFRAGFSVLSVVALILLVMAWRGAETNFLWSAAPWFRWLMAALMLPVLVLFFTSVAAPNPTAVAGEAALGREARGITRITRHPMLWSFTLWSLLHVLANGDTAAMVFFAAFAVTALLGMPSIDAKLRARAPNAWAGFAARTSVLPFAAIAGGRNRLALAEIGWAAPLLGLIAWAALLHFHRALFGVPALLLG
ncbi:putative membrane protein [Humitalea rosea]|uniref:Putative membrane protein n=1 Tax=Humitalea rosea TaxID=990373 RepID=A0A2W7HXQ8_9PROT|nr:NnrU family protein [Humitalea rosea]PZW39356.1 putative membrane protein [Humitalea rosea]